MYMITRVKKYTYLLLPLFLVIFSFPTCVKGSTESVIADQMPVVSTQKEHIDSMYIEAVINTDATVSVTETIEYDFANQSKHGIYRTIPLGFVAKREPDHTDIQVSGVKDESGASYDYSITSKDPVEIKIGNPDVEITGKHTYKIFYTIKRSIGYYNNYDEFYWNLTGDVWEIPIYSVSADIFLPKKVSPSEIKTAEYCGIKGSTDKCGLFYAIDNVVKYSVNAGYEILPYNQVTIAVGFPKGLVVAPTNEDFFLNYLSRFWFFPLPLVVVALWFRKKFVYLRSRSKFFRKNTIVAEYDAGEFTPLEVGLLVNKKLDNKALSALIIWFAIRGYVKIENKDGEFCFTNLKDVTPDMTESEKIVVKMLGNICESSFGITETTQFSLAMSSAASRLVTRDYVSNKNLVKNLPVNSFSSSFGQIFVFLFLAVNPGVFIWFLIGNWAGFIFSTSLVLIALITPFFRNALVRLTEKGFEAERRFLGLKQYIQVAEADRIAFANAPAKTPELFEKLLPFAMVFGLEKKWASEFEGLYTVNPSWYDGGTTGAFSTVAFVGSFDSIQTSVKSAIASSSGSSWSSGSGGSGGGGSSGGGGGGGGGGSW